MYKNNFFLKNSNFPNLPRKKIISFIKKKVYIVVFFFVKIYYTLKKIKLKKYLKIFLKLK